MDHNVRKNSFYLDPSNVYFNFGTFGVCPKPVLEKRFKYQEQLEFNPQLGYSKQMLEKLEASIEELRKRFNCPGTNSPSDTYLKDGFEVAIINNATMGLSAVLRSIPVNPGDSILLTNWTYYAITMNAQEIFVEKGGKIETLQLDVDDYFKSDDHLIDIYVGFVKKYPAIRYAILDHIFSGLPVVQPLKRLVSELRALGVTVIIDGAHAPGQLLDLNIKDIDPDIYVANLHKWCFVPRSTAFIAIKSNRARDKHDPITLKHPIISWWHHHSEIHKRFIFPGTTDVTNVMCIQDAFEFIDHLGGMESIYNYNTRLLDRGIEYLEEKWNVKSLHFPSSAPFMRLIPLPKLVQKYFSFDEMIISPFERRYYRYTHEQFQFTVAITRINKILYFRICCQVYAELDHFVKLGEAVIKWGELLQQGIVPDHYNIQL